MTRRHRLSLTPMLAACTRPIVLAALLGASLSGAAHAAPARPDVRRVRRPTRTAAPYFTDVARIPAGTYRPLFGSAGAQRIRVGAFALDRTPVTRGQYLAFVLAHPAWRRDFVRPVFAEHRYLADWPSDTSVGDGEAARAPVVNVSWFAARAFCAAAGKRLPTLDEWEYAAAASAKVRDANADPSFRDTQLALYVARRAGRTAVVGRGEANVYGVRDLHDLVWEWTLDFNSGLVADDSRLSGSGRDARDQHLFCASAAIGASDPSNYPAFLRFAVRAGLTARSTTSGVGFRCAADVSQ